MKKFNILILEDNAEILDLIEMLVRIEGHIAYPASLPSLAFKVLQTEEIDLIISDIKMPEMNGVEFLKAIRQQGIKIPVIFYSSEIGIEWEYEDLFKALNASFIQKFGKMDLLTKEMNKRLQEISAEGPI